MSAYAGQILTKPTPAADVKTAEQGEKCVSCGFTVTNSQPDCRCS
jgi:hypothetical protein